jgi:hypothetical protein
MTCKRIQTRVYELLVFVPSIQGWIYYELVLYFPCFSRLYHAATNPKRGGRDVLDPWGCCDLTIRFVFDVPD